LCSIACVFSSAFIGGSWILNCNNNRTKPYGKLQALGSLLQVDMSSRTSKRNNFKSARPCCRHRKAERLLPNAQYDAHHAMTGCHGRHHHEQRRTALSFHHTDIVMKLCLLEMTSSQPAGDWCKSRSFPTTTAMPSILLECIPPQ
jgi:hypothetical protein